MELFDYTPIVKKPNNLNTSKNKIPKYTKIKFDTEWITLSDRQFIKIPFDSDEDNDRTSNVKKMLDKIDLYCEIKRLSKEEILDRYVLEIKI